MIKKENALKKRKQFNYLFKNGNYFSNKYFSIVYLKLKTKNFKIGYSVSKKIGKAVVRNKTKRRLKEIVRKFSGQIKNEYYIIIQAKENIVSIPFNVLYDEVFASFEKIGLLYENN